MQHMRILEGIDMPEAFPTAGENYWRGKLQEFLERLEEWDDVEYVISDMREALDNA